MKKHLFCPGCWSILAGFYILFLVPGFLLPVIAMPAFTQIDTVKVVSDIPPAEGNLNHAIQVAITKGNLSHTIFELEPNGYYILNGTITVPAGEHLTIVAPEPGITQATAPPQLVWSSNQNMWTDYQFKYDFNFNCFGDITLKNIWLLYADTNGEQIRVSLQIQDNPISSKGEIAEFEGVIFDYAACPHNASGAVGVTAKHFNGTFKNCYFKNCVDNHFSYYGRAVSFPFDSPGWHIENLRFEHCTFANIGYVYMQENGNYGDNVHFNHCTFLNVVMFSLESGWWYRMSVTNSIWMNGFMLGIRPVDYKWGISQGGTIEIDSVSAFGFDVPFCEQDRRILFAHNSYHIEKWLQDWMDENPYSQELRRLGANEQIPVPHPMLGPGTLAFFESDDFPFMNKANLHEDSNPYFITAPTALENLKLFLYYKWFSSEDMNWAYLPAESAQRKWPFSENLAYTNEVLLTAGMNGFPLGDLYHWYPEEYKQWKAQENAEHARIYHWLNTGKDSIFSAVITEPDPIIPLDFILSQNYPNPFNSKTRITYSVPKYSYISLKVYNQLGEEVTTLFEDFREIGDYESTFDGAGFPSGVYFYILAASNPLTGTGLISMKMRKFLLLK